MALVDAMVAGVHAAGTYAAVAGAPAWGSGHMALAEGRAASAVSWSRRATSGLRAHLARLLREGPDRTLQLGLDGGSVRSPRLHWHNMPKLVARRLSTASPSHWVSKQLNQRPLPDFVTPISPACPVHSDRRAGQTTGEIERGAGRGRTGAQCNATCPFYPSLDRLPGQFCRLIDRISSSLQSTAGAPAAGSPGRRSHHRRGCSGT